jgi:trimethylamine-N-oxide reductase (cytochrome c)
VVINSPWFDRDCKLADLVLPVSTNFERNDITEPGKCGVYIPASIVNLRCAVYHQKCIEPVGESKSDFEILSAVAERLGIEDKYTEGNTEDGWLRKLYAKTAIPMKYEEFKEKGYYVWPFLDDYKPCKQLKPFYDDPEKNPLETPSGKIEIFSQWLFKEYGADNPEIPPVPHYIPEWEGRFIKPLMDKYPLQLLTPHPKLRYHGKYNDVTWLREIYKVKGSDGYEYEPVYMNTTDADARGLKSGDIVRVFNDRGQILCGVATTQRLTKGVVRIAYGSWWDVLEPKPGAIDRGGNSNFLTPSRGMSEHHLGLASNSCLVEVERADLEELSKKYPEGWAGKYRSWVRE